MSTQGNYTIIARYKHNESYCNAFNNIGVKYVILIITSK